MRKRLTAMALALILGVGALAPVYAQGAIYWNDEDRAWWDSDNWITDPYGFYDEDFNWTARDRDWDTWYGSAGNDWSLFDDVGEGGWFDV